MLLEIKLQEKNGTVVVRAPDDTIYTFDVKENEVADATCKRLGRTILEILSDKEMPEQTMGPGPRGPRAAPEFDSEQLEGNLRATMDSVVPGGSRLLDFLQSVSTPDDEATG